MPPRRPPPPRRSEPRKEREYDFEKYDYFVVRCVDKNRIQRFETLRTLRGESPFLKRCPRCGGPVGKGHDRPRQLRPDKRFVA